MAYGAESMTMISSLFGTQPSERRRGTKKVTAYGSFSRASVYRVGTRGGDPLLIPRNGKTNSGSVCKPTCLANRLGRLFQLALQQGQLLTIESFCRF